MIDTAFDFQSDTPLGKDPDACCPTLRRYHKLLWSKPLPDGSLFELSDSTPGAYLYHCSKIGEFRLSSDSITASYARVKDKRILSVIKQVEQSDVESFRNIGYTIGGMLIFPSNRVDRKPTINAARGLNAQIKDRFDLTLECIRRHYQNESSPLEETFQRYVDFFRLFKSFRGYLEFFLLQDLVSSDFFQVKTFLPFDDFKTPPHPLTSEMYLAYRRRNIEFLEARNRRIQEYCNANHL
jgi:hypothetical protein